MKPKDWTLLVLASGNRKPLQPVQLQKSLFLVSKKLNNNQRRTRSFYEFSPYDYGPFCSAVYSDAEALESDGLVEIAQAGARFRMYGITPAGVQRADVLRGQLDPIITGYLDKVVDWTRGLPFKQLVTAIYEAFPEMKENSVFQE